MREARRSCLLHLPAQEIAHRLGYLAARWLDPDYPPRVKAVPEMSAATGFPEAMVSLGLDRAFQQLIPPRLEELIVEELGDCRRLDGPASGSRTGHDLRWAAGPELITHVLAGSIVTPGLWSLCFGLVVKAANLLKCSSQDPVFLKRFADSLRRESPDLAECVSVWSWTREEVEMTRSALDAADLAIAFGDDASISHLQSEVRPPRRFIGHGHRVSLAVIDSEAFTPAVAASVAEDVAFYDQQGCLSPHVAFLVGERSDCLDFCQCLSQAMQDAEVRWPRRALAPAEAAAIQQVRAEVEMRQAAGEPARLSASAGSTAWSLLYDERPAFEPSCLNRVLRVKRLPRLDMLEVALRPVRGRVQAIAVSPGSAAGRVAALGGQSGFTRICPPGQLQNPPIHWAAGGIGNLVPLITWLNFDP